MSRGLDINSLKELTLGQLVDYCIEWNKQQGQTESGGKPEKEAVIKREATQRDWDAFWG